MRNRYSLHALKYYYLYSQWDMTLWLTELESCLLNLNWHCIGHPLYYTFHKSSRIYNNYSMSLSWIWSDKITNERVARVGYNHFISNKGEWNNCFSKFSNRVLPPNFTSTILQSVRKENLAHCFPYDVKLGLLAHSRSFLANQKARNAIVGAENLLSIYIAASVWATTKSNLAVNSPWNLINTSAGSRPWAKGWGGGGAIFFSLSCLLFFLLWFLFLPKIRRGCSDLPGPSLRSATKYWLSHCYPMTDQRYLNLAYRYIFTYNILISVRIKAVGLRRVHQFCLRIWLKSFY